MGHLTDNVHACLVEAQKGDQKGGSDDRGDGSGLCGDVGQRRAGAGAFEHWFEPVSDPEEKRRGTCTERQCDQVRVAQMCNQRGDDVRKGVPMGRDAQNVFQLAERDQNSGCGDETGDHRMAQEICEKPQTKHAKQQQEPARQKGKGQGRGGVSRRALLCDFADCRSGQERYDGNGTNGQRGAGAQDRIKNDRDNRRIDPRFRRQACEQCIGKRLRDQHDRDDQCGDQVI